jgi:hypothetical protein
MFLTLSAYLRLIRFDLYLARNDFGGLYKKVRSYPLSVCTSSPEAVVRICSAVDIASIWYWKKVLCLQRSATIVCLLRRHGVAAQMVLGVQQLPFSAHAWVEVEGHVVNDKPYTPEMYEELDRC